MTSSDPYPNQVFGEAFAAVTRSWPAGGEISPDLEAKPIVYFAEKVYSFLTSVSSSPEDNDLLSLSSFLHFLSAF